MHGAAWPHRFLCHTVFTRKRRHVHGMLGLRCVRAGRVGELAYSSWNNLEWNELHKVPVLSLGSLKTGKYKTIPFCHGKTRHQCIFLFFADYFVVEAGPKGATGANEPGKASKPLFPLLNHSTDSNGVLNNMLHKLRTREVPKYKSLVEVANLPTTATAGTKTNMRMQPGCTERRRTGALPNPECFHWRAG